MDPAVKKVVKVKMKLVEMEYGAKYGRLVNPHLGLVTWYCVTSTGFEGVNKEVAEALEEAYQNRRKEVN